MVLPTRLQNDDEELFEVGSPEVMNQAIDIINNTIEGKKFNGFEVNPVAVHCTKPTNTNKCG